MALTIERLGHLGDGIAAGPVFAPRVLPGEVIEGVVDGDRIAKPRIVTPSPDRVKAPCPHYKGCGGCALQHASDGFVSGWKAEVVRQAMAAQGLEAGIRNVLTSPARSRRRAVFSGRRLKSGPVVGFHGPGSDAVTGIPECRVLTPGIVAAIAPCSELVEALCSRKGEMRFAVTLGPAGLDVDASGGRAVEARDWATLAALAERHDLARLAVNGEVVVTRRPPVQSFDGVEVVPPPAAFLQATEEGEAALRSGVIEAIAGASRVVDLFAGCGTFALSLAPGAEVHAVEGDKAMVSALDVGWRNAQGLKRVSTEVRDLFQRPLLSDELAGFDAAVIDPPRAGAEAQVRALAEAQPRRIAFVSCNPVTFARDARILSNSGYRMDWLDVIDQFRWSPHIEIVACFRR